MCPPIPGSFLFCPCTIAIAFHRSSDSTRFSSFLSPGYGTSSCFGIVFRYGVVISLGVGTPASRARRRSSPSNSAPCSQSCATTSSNASIHSATSARKSCFAASSNFVVIVFGNTPVKEIAATSPRGRAIGHTYNDIRLTQKRHLAHNAEQREALCRRRHLDRYTRH